MPHITTERLYLDKPPDDPDARVVPEGSMEANYLLAGEGVEISDELAEKFNLGKGATPESPLDRERRLLADAERRGAHSEAASRRTLIANMEADQRQAEEAKARRSSSRRTADSEAEATAGSEAAAEAEASGRPSDTKARRQAEDK